MILWALRIVTPANTERQTAEPLQGGNGPPGAIGDSHRLTTSSAVAALGSERIFRRCELRDRLFWPSPSLFPGMWRSTLAPLFIEQYDVHRPRPKAR